MKLDYTELSNKVPLDVRSRRLRHLVLDALEGSGRGHLGPALSLLEIVRTLYDSVLVHDSTNVSFAQRDRFILSKGHGCLGLYVVLSDHGYFSTSDLKKFCSFDASIGGHPESATLPGIEFSTGSLGHGLSAGIGMAMAASLRNEKWRTFVLLGDGELNEGSIWEAALHASHHQLGALTIIIDFNGMQASGKTNSVVSLHPLVDKWRAFGFNVLEVNGHNILEIEKSLNASVIQFDKPRVIIAHTVKGKGIKSAEHSTDWHHKAKINKYELDMLRKEVDNL